jgi:hypothetical protein
MESGQQSLVKKGISGPTGGARGLDGSPTPKTMKMSTGRRPEALTKREVNCLAAERPARVT